MKKYINLFDFQQTVNYKTEILLGLTVALALVPEAVGFALIAGLSPLTGLYAAFTEKFDVQNDPNEVIIDFKESRVVDMSAIEALNKTTERYLKQGKRVQLIQLSKDCQKLLRLRIRLSM